MTVKRLTKADLPQALGAFKPVGYVLLALGDDDQLHAGTAALRDAGFDQEDILPFGSGEQVGRMDQMLDHASDFAGFGYEVVLMRRYRQLSAQGFRWLLVRAPSDSQTRCVAEIAKRLDSPMAVKYHRLAEEDLV